MSTTIAGEPTTATRLPIKESILEVDEQGRAWIKGANTKVIEVALDWIAYRWDAETIHREHPHLSLAQIHAALAHYFANQATYDVEVAGQLEQVESLRAASQQPSLHQLRVRLSRIETGNKIIIHEAEEGGYWAQVPSIPGCATQGDRFEDLLQNLYEAVEGCLSVEVTPAMISEHDRVLEIAI